MYGYHYGCGPRGWGHRHLSNNPPVNISETESEFTIQLFAPSLIKENFILTTKNDVLTIKYKGGADTSAGRFTRKEFRAEEIERSFDLKGKIDADAITARYAEGVLTVHLPKTDAAQKPSQNIAVS
jgi:HSP20 family protein